MSSVLRAAFNFICAALGAKCEAPGPLLPHLALRQGVAICTKFQEPSVAFLEKMNNHLLYIFIVV